MEERFGEWGAEWIGSGTCLFVGGTRDIQFSVVGKTTTEAIVRSIRATFAAKRIKGATVVVS